ncbi:hypothetical protein Dimus_039107 [Dionaea muscipula]
MLGKSDPITRRNRRLGDKVDILLALLALLPLCDDIITGTLEVSDHCIQFFDPLIATGHLVTPLVGVTGHTSQLFLEGIPFTLHLVALFRHFSQLLLDPPEVLLPLLSILLQLQVLPLGFLNSDVDLPSGSYALLESGRRLQREEGIRG